ncbi:MAG: N-acetylmuramoyl-L-alanine amidase [Clostridia bacterium]|nr:N-acetylmuramoyl-L-alanine amidase [Clostridia bacterium]
MKQNRAFFFFGAVFLSCTLLFSAVFRVCLQQLETEIPTNGSSIRDSPVIILDAGHGGEDGGATGTNGVLEKDLNLTVTNTLAALLRLSGYTVVETRTEDKLLYTEGTKKGHKKQSDLENRLFFTTQYEQCLLISIHMNTFPDTFCQGAQVWFSPNHPTSRELGERIQNRITNLVQQDNHRRIKEATSGIYILRHAQVPAVLIECGFLSTPSDCERLCTPEYQKKLVLAIFDAIVKKTEL